MMGIIDRKSALQDPTVILSEYGADALRLYLVNSPVVHAETLRFKKEGVFAVVKDVFLPWYNAYRFLVQNVLRLEADCGERFLPSQVTPTAFNWHSTRVQSLLTYNHSSCSPLYSLAARHASNYAETLS